MAIALRSGDVLALCNAHSQIGCATKPVALRVVLHLDLRNFQRGDIFVLVHTARIDYATPLFGVYFASINSS